MCIEKDIKTGVMLATGLLTNKPCWVYSLAYTAGGAGVAWTVYNGRDTSGEKTFVFSGISTSTMNIVFRKAMYFHNGFYAVKATDAVILTVQYKEEY